MKVIYPLVTARYPWCRWLIQGLPVTLGLPLKKNFIFGSIIGVWWAMCKVVVKKIRKPSGSTLLWHETCRLFLCFAPYTRESAGTSHLCYVHFYCLVSILKKKKKSQSFQNFLVFFTFCNVTISHFIVGTNVFL